MDDLHIRPLETIEEFRRAETIQKQVWNQADIEVVPLHLLTTAQKNDGLILGAFVDERMVGWLFGFLGRTEAGEFKHCSHMMGVRKAYRGAGIGERLKVWQREYVRDQGLDLITWTYDPLESVNAYLNIGKLGAICRTYRQNVYGDLRDGLNEGLPTDRFEVEWWMAAPHVEARLAHRDRARRNELATRAVPANTTRRTDDGLLEPLVWELVDAPAAFVEIPTDFQRIKGQNPDLARRWRSSTRELFTAYFAQGYRVVDFVTTGAGVQRRGLYVLTTASI